MYYSFRFSYIPSQIIEKFNGVHVQPMQLPYAHLSIHGHDRSQVKDLYYLLLCKHSPV